MKVHSCAVLSPGPHCSPGADSGFQCPDRCGPGSPLGGVEKVTVPPVLETPRFVGVSVQRTKLNHQII